MLHSVEAVLVEGLVRAALVPMEGHGLVIARMGTLAEPSAAKASVVEGSLARGDLAVEAGLVVAAVALAWPFPVLLHMVPQGSSPTGPPPAQTIFHLRSGPCL